MFYDNISGLIVSNDCFSVGVSRTFGLREQWRRHKNSERGALCGKAWVQISCLAKRLNGSKLCAKCCCSMHHARLCPCLSCCVCILWVERDHRQGELTCVGVSKTMGKEGFQACLSKRRPGSQSGHHHTMDLLPTLGLGPLPLSLSCLPSCWFLPISSSDLPIFSHHTSFLRIWCGSIWCWQPFLSLLRWYSHTNLTLENSQNLAEVTKLGTKSQDRSPQPTPKPHCLLPPFCSAFLAHRAPRGLSLLRPSWPVGLAGSLSF